MRTITKKTIKTAKTLAEKMELVSSMLLNIRQTFIAVGEILYETRRESHFDYERLAALILKDGHQLATIKSSIAAYLYTKKDERDKDGKHRYGVESDQRIPPILLWAGARNSKIAAMPEKNQNRLISQEKFRVVMSNGQVSPPKTWLDHDDISRNTLIGDSGQILTVDEQREKMYRKTELKLLFLGSINLEKKEIIIRDDDGKMRMKTTLPQLVAKLQPIWDKLVAEAEKVRQEAADGRRRGETGGRRAISGR